MYVLEIMCFCPLQTDIYSGRYDPHTQEELKNQSSWQDKRTTLGNHHCGHRLKKKSQIAIAMAGSRTEMKPKTHGGCNHGNSRSFPGVQMGCNFSPEQDMYLADSDKQVDLLGLRRRKGHDLPYLFISVSHSLADLLNTISHCESPHFR